MYKRILSSAISSAGLIGAVLFGAPAIAQDIRPNQQPPVTSQPPPTNPMPDPSQVPTQTQPPPTTKEPPAAEGAASVKVSDTLYGSDGNPVGTIEAIEGTNAVLSTGTVKVRIPVSAIAKGPKGAMIGLTKAEVEAQAQKSAPPPH